MCTQPLLALVVCAVLCQLGSAVSPLLINGTVLFSESRISNNDFDLAYVTLNFDQEIFVQEGIYCGSVEEEVPEWGCKPCDWSGQNVSCSVIIFLSRFSNNVGSNLP